MLLTPTQEEICLGNEFDALEEAREKRYFPSNASVYHFHPIAFVEQMKMMHEGLDIKAGIDWLTTLAVTKEDLDTNPNYFKVPYKNDVATATRTAITEKAEEDVEGKLKNLLINTSIANTTYIQNVIKAYVKGDEQAKEQLYHEPAHSDEEMAALQKMFGVDVKKMIKKELLETKRIKKDQTNIKLPNPKILK